MISRSVALVVAVAIGFAPSIGGSAASGQTMAPGRAAPVPGGTPVELMVTKEVDSRSAKEGDRFKLLEDRKFRSWVVCQPVPVSDPSRQGWVTLRAGNSVQYLHLHSGNIVNVIGDGVQVQAHAGEEVYLLTPTP